MRMCQQVTAIQTEQWPLCTCIEPMRVNIGDVEVWVQDDGKERCALRFSAKVGQLKGSCFAVALAAGIGRVEWLAGLLLPIRCTVCCLQLRDCIAITTTMRALNFQAPSLACHMLPCRFLVSHEIELT